MAKMGGGGKLVECRTTVGGGFKDSRGARKDTRVRGLPKEENMKRRRLSCGNLGQGSLDGEGWGGGKKRGKDVSDFAYGQGKGITVRQMPKLTTVKGRAEKGCGGTGAQKKKCFVEREPNADSRMSPWGSGGESDPSQRCVPGGGGEGE